eukprot:scaffold62451_cov28-Tisochrysis_lutea.AAC.6
MPSTTHSPSLRGQQVSPLDEEAGRVSRHGEAGAAGARKHRLPPPRPAHGPSTAVPAPRRSGRPRRREPAARRTSPDEKRVVKSRADGAVCEVQKRRVWPICEISRAETHDVGG